MKVAEKRNGQIEATIYNSNFDNMWEYVSNEIETNHYQTFFLCETEEDYQGIGHIGRFEGAGWYQDGGENVYTKEMGLNNQSFYYDQLMISKV